MCWKNSYNSCLIQPRFIDLSRGILCKLLEREAGGEFAEEHMVLGSDETLWLSCGVHWWDVLWLQKRHISWLESSFFLSIQNMSWNMENMFSICSSWKKVWCRALWRPFRQSYISGTQVSYACSATFFCLMTLCYSELLSRSCVIIMLLWLFNNSSQLS